jgi:F-type H+-transporting ATPase subunit delta
MGILANHVPSIEQLKPGLVEIIEESGGSKQFFRASASTHSQRNKYLNGSALREPVGIMTALEFTDVSLATVSGGFAIVQPGSQLSINAVEGFPLEDFSADVSNLLFRIHLGKAELTLSTGHRPSNLRSLRPREL